MRLAGFNFTKINAEKKKSAVKEIKIDTKINIENIKEIKSEFANSKESLLAVEFNYSIEYKNLANLEFGGNLIIILDSKKSKDILKDFENKKISNDFKVSIFNIILKKSSIKALELEEDLNLPAHFRLPTLKPSKKK
ncbi:MAG: hypothetical protein ACOC1P_00165 [Minisyncoccales bacterium]